MPRPLHLLTFLVLCAPCFAWAGPPSQNQTTQSNTVVAQWNAELNARDLVAIHGTNTPQGCLSNASTGFSWITTGLKSLLNRTEWRVPTSVHGSRWASVDRDGFVSELDLSDLVNLSDQLAAKRSACVLDRVTNLVWAVNLEGSSPKRWHPNAPAASGKNPTVLMEQAKNTNWCGRTNWDLPNRAQALSLADYMEIHTKDTITALSIFGFTKFDYMWTRTSVAGGSVTTYHVGFNYQTKQPVTTGISEHFELWKVSIPYGSTGSDDQDYNPQSNSTGPVLLVSPTTCRAFNQVYRR